MSTKAKHIQRSHRSKSRVPIFKSEDRTKHEFIEVGGYKIPVYKEHKKKYDGRGNRINAE